MKLNAPNGKLLVLHAHDFALIGLGCDFQAVGQGISADDQRMIARRGEWIWHAFKKVLAVMLYRRSFAMHHPVVHHNISTENMANALVAQADAQRRNTGAERSDDFI